MDTKWLREILSRLFVRPIFYGYKFNVSIISAIQPLSIVL